ETSELERWRSCVSHCCLFGLEDQYPGQTRNSASPPTAHGTCVASESEFWRTHECPRRRRSNALDRTSARERRRTHRPANSFAKKSIMSAKASTARGPRNRQSRSVCRKRDGPG